MTASTTSYLTGAVKRDPATMAVAIRTVANDRHPGLAWAVMTVDKGGHYSDGTEVETWPDVAIE